MISKRWFAVAAVLLVAGISFAAVASAGTDREQVDQTYQAYKAKYNGAKDQYIQAKQQFEKAKADYRSARTKERSLELFNATKDYMVKGIDAMIAYLRLIETNTKIAENKDIAPYDASDNINKYISSLEQLKLDVQGATTKQQLIDAGNSVEGTWNNVKVDVKYYTGYVMNNRLELFLVKANNASTRLDSEIQKLKSEGIDTTKLESELATYNEWISKAEAEVESAKENYKTHGGFDTYGHVTDLKEANKFLQDTDQHFRQANEYLKKAKEALKNAIAELRVVKKA